MESPPAQIPRSSSIYPEDVSPPDSPIANGHDYSHSRKSSFNVSPISTENPTPLASRSPSVKPGRYNSNLPVPKKNLKKFWKLPDKGGGGADQEQSSVRWDEYSGEPTDSDRGKLPSTTLGAVRLHEDPNPGRLNLHNYGTSTHISGGNTIPRKRVGNRDISDTSITMRPEWKGAGGRHKIVAPPVDKPLTAGQSPQFAPGQLKRQQIEEEERRRRAEIQENERREQERREQLRLEEENQKRSKMEEEEKERQRELHERAEAQRRERERAEQMRVDRERAEQERRTRQKVVQARRERDLAALKAEKDQAIQRQKQEQAAANSPKSPDWAIYPPDTKRGPASTSDHSDTGENSQARDKAPPAKPKSPEPTSMNSPPPRAAASSASPAVEDRRSPLARNPSDEEDAGSPGATPPQAHDFEIKPLNVQNRTWQPRGSSLPKDNQTSPDPTRIESKFRAELQNLSVVDEPKSRFSATTYATTNFNESPPQTPEQVPDSPDQNTPESILNRKRPVPQSGVKVARKPTPSEVPKPPPDPEVLHTKSLPKAPADAPKIPPVQTLQAKQAALQRRKRNIETVIHELTEVVQPSSIAYDMASRQEIKKTVEQLKRELSDVVKDEHETGLKLHRAWKRQDDSTIYEPTSIWVRRVTT